MAQMCAAALEGDVAAARERNDRLLALHRRLFIEANPDPHEVGARRDGPHPERIAASARAVVAAVPRHGPRRAARSGLSRVITRCCSPWSCPNRPRAPLPVLAALCLPLGLFLLAGCESVTGIAPSKRIDYKSASSSPALELPPDLTTPRYDDRYQVTTATGTRGGQRQQEQRALGVPAHQSRREDRARRQRALAGRQGHAGAGVEHRARVLAGVGLRARDRAAADGDDGNRLRREPRGDPGRSASGAPSASTSTSSTRRTGRTSSARASSAASSPAPWRSSCRIAAWSRCPPARSTTRRRRPSCGRSCRPIRRSRPRCSRAS